MQYRANPVLVEANQIVYVDAPNKSGDVQILTSAGPMLATQQMTARYMPKPGDYVVTQEDGYVYLNPKDVFERKYSPVVAGTDVPR